MSVEPKQSVEFASDVVKGSIKEIKDEMPKNYQDQFFLLQQHMYIIGLFEKINRKN